MRAIVLVLLGLVAVNCVFVKKVQDPNASVFVELEEIDNNDMGRRLLDTIALQMRNKAPLADIAKMLQNLRENLVFQQQDADLQHAADEAGCDAEITGYNRRIDFASTEIEEATTEINQLSSQAAQLTNEIENKGRQLKILNDQEEILRSTRIQEAADFEVRVRQSGEVIEALNVIAQKLGAITPETDAKAVLLELHKMGGTNPIAALVSLASAFSPERLANVQSKIGELRSSIQQAIVDDQQNETQAQVDFQTMIVQFGEQRQNIATAVSEATNKLSETNNSLGLQRKRNEDAGRELTAATAGKQQKEEECESLRTQYARDSEHRGTEIAIIRQVEEILATKLEGASGYLQVRIDKQ